MVADVTGGHGEVGAVGRRALVVGLVLALAFPAVLYAAGRLGGVATGGDVLSSEAANYVQAAADAAVLVVVAVVLLAARLPWRFVLNDAGQARSRAAVVGLVLLVVWVVLAATQLVGPLRPGSTGFVVSLVVLVVLVGLAEELVYRGVLVVGLRQATPEWAVWLIATALFAFAHLGSVLSGAGPGQLVSTFVLGSACYAARRVTGTLGAAVGVHALYDLTIGLRTRSSSGVPVALQLGTGVVFYALALTGALLAVRFRPHSSRQIAPPSRGSAR